MKLVYLAHPIAGDREANLSRARRWLRWMLDAHPDVAPVVPWLPACEVLEETPEHRLRGLRQDLAILARCDEVWLVGGEVSPGMSIEREAAYAAGLAVRDLSEMGPEPPRLA